MSNLHEKPVLKTIIAVSEKLEGCQLEETVLAEEKKNLAILAAYLEV